ncbi:MAG: phosphatase PAP2 family protein [Paramuribaculum sp.]|nr:phosphatase PAP2 family protein [Paramuribaculum sp.]MDE6303318.1 phosphatase PAP2 family protein [Paramuribaculum sp.]
MLHELLASLDHLDGQLLIFFNSHHTQWADNFMMMFSSKYVWIPMYLIFTFMVFRCYDLKRALVVLLGIGVAIALADQLCATLIRQAVERLRPSNPENPLSAFITVVNDYRGGRYGFPSCHAANSFALVVYLSMLLRRRRFIIFLIIWAVVNCYSRLYLGVHYPGDILVGAIIGSCVGLLCASLVRMIFSSMSQTVALPRNNESVTLNTLVGPSSVRLSLHDIGLLSGIATAAILGIIALLAG